MANKSFLSALAFPGAFRRYLARIFSHIHCDVTATVSEVYMITAPATESYVITATATESNVLSVTLTDNQGVNI